MTEKPTSEMESRGHPIEEHMRWQNREWMIQRIGTFLLFLIVILGACGAFSRGFLSNKTLSAADGSVEVEYEKFGRDRTPIFPPMTGMTLTLKKEVEVRPETLNLKDRSVFQLNSFATANE